MKKFCALLCIVTVAFSIAACGNIQAQKHIFKMEQRRL